MSTFLKITGLLWALVGVGNIVMMPAGLLTWDLGIAYNMALYIIPGVGVMAFGNSLDRNRKPRT